MAKLLIVDDERVLREGLKRSLQAEGYSAETARDGDEALKKFVRERFDLVLLDVMMPRMNGFRCCEEIRKLDPLTPVVFLTAKDAETDQIRAKGLGADDFVSKTASDALLLACIRRALARTEQLGESRAAKPGRIIRIGDVEVDVKAFEVRKDGAAIARLTRTEADVIVCLDEHRGEIVLFDDLIASLRGNGFVCEDGMVYTHISHVRTKLGAAGRHVVTHHGIGYSLRDR